MHPHGIMFHHFFNNKYCKGQGAISAEKLADIIEYLGPKNIISAKEWIIRAKEGTLNNSNICMTFDDALLCQYEIALPVLKHYKIKAFWFVYSSVITGGIEMLEVYRKFRTMMFPDIEAFYEKFFKLLEKSEYGNLTNEALYVFDPKKYLQEASFYSNNDRKFRYIRDKVLGSVRYKKIMQIMLDNNHIDVKKFSADLWMGKKHLKKLFSEGHIIGLHSHTHPTTMAEISSDQQRVEYETNISILYQLLGQKPETVSHPCNSYSKTTLVILKKLGINIGFRANMQKKVLSLLEFPREDHADIIKKLKDEKN